MFTAIAESEATVSRVGAVNSASAQDLSASGGAGDGPDDALALEQPTVGRALGVLGGEALIVLLIDESGRVDVVTMIESSLGARSEEFNRPAKDRPDWRTQP